MSGIESASNSRVDHDSASSQKRSFENTLAFVSDERVSSFPIDTKTQIPPRSKSMTQTQWERNWRIVGAYLGTDKLLEEIGRDPGITKERVRQIVKSGVKKLHQIQSTEIRDEFLLGKFGYWKPLPIVLRRRRSESKGGVAVKIEQALAKGKTLPKIKEEFTSEQVLTARTTLRQWGIEIPYEHQPILPKYLKLRDPELADWEKQKLLDSIEHHGALRILSSGEEPLIVSVSKVGRKAGLFFSNKKLILFTHCLGAKEFRLQAIHSR